MFLTRIPDSVQLDDYAIHQNIMKMTSGRRVLYQRKGVEIDILTTYAIEGSRDFTARTTALAVGKSILFTMRVNPVVSKVLEKGQRGKRFPVPPQELRNWTTAILGRNGTRADFSILSEGPRFSRKGQSTITLSSIMVSGVMEILDAEKFRHALANGIGHGKALGFGMLNIFAHLPP